MPDFATVFDDIKSAFVSNAQELGQEYKEQALADGKALLNEVKDDLHRWLSLLAADHLKPDEFEWLVKSNKSLAKMTALKQSGIAAQQVKQFAKGLLNTIVDTSLKAVVAAR